jgi:Protein of unknown function (DUF2569)
MADAKNLEGIRGWLLLPLLGLIISPLRVGWTVYHDLLPVFTEGHWQVLTNPQSGVYHPLWGPLILFELLGNLGLIAASLALLVLFLRKSRRTPLLMIAFYLLVVAFVGGDLLLGGLLPVQGDDSEQIRDLIRSAMAAVIWIPYFIRSRRVKATFVR